MPYIPHTEEEIRQMLDTINLSDIDELFSEIPGDLRSGKLTNVPSGISEMEVGRMMSARSQQDGQYINFIGGGVFPTPSFGRNIPVIGHRFLVCLGATPCRYLVLLTLDMTISFLDC